MAGAVRSKYLRLLTIYACSYALVLLVVSAMDLSGREWLPMPLLASGLALLPLVYYVVVFPFASRQLGQQVAHIIGMAILSIPMAAISAMTGGYASFNNVAIIIMVFLSAMLGLWAPLVLVWVQIIAIFTVVAGGYTAAFGDTPVGMVMLGFYATAALLGWLTFRGHYTQEDPETERLRDTLREQQLESEGVITAISDGVAIVNRQGIVVHANQQFLDVTALSDSELIGKHYSNVMSSKVRIVASSITSPRIGPNVEKVLKTGEPVVIDNESIEYVDGRPSMDVSLSITALRNDDGDVSAVMIICRDITPIMRMQRMKDSLIMTASHELRTPITVIAGYADLLLGSANNLTVKQRHYLERTKETTTHLTEMVNDMLDIGRLEAGQRENNPEPIDLEPFLQSIVEDYIAQFSTKHMTLKLDAQSGQVVVDRDRLRQVIDCLLSNAYKFVPDKGQVVLSATFEQGAARIAVTDNGKGVPPEAVQIVFDKFTKLDTTGTIPGAGLGLAIAKTIVENWGGTIAVENAPSGGARFYFTVPITAPNQQQPHDATKETK